VIRIAAVGDVHVGLEDSQRAAQAFAPVVQQADVLLLAGDLTRCGDPAEMKAMAAALDPLPIPVIAVLGNHDHHADRVDECTRALTDVGIEVLEGTSTVVEVGGRKLGVAGTKGFGGGFTGGSISEFGEPLMKQFARCTIEMAAALEDALSSLPPVDWRVALLHYSPIAETLQGEPLQIYPFLGSYLLGEVIDRVGADLALHGHAHSGTERGMTPGGIKVRNVAQPVIGTAYRLFELPEPGALG
jgi:Icc-related predicted phosphoesterase